MNAIIGWLPAWGEVIAARLVTVIFLLILASVVVWILRLHFSARYASFDLVKLVTHPDGCPDSEKIRLWGTYGLGSYAFLHLLAKDHSAFLTYGPWFLGFIFAHLVANRMTAKKMAPPDAAEPSTDPAKQDGAAK